MNEVIVFEMPKDAGAFNSLVAKEHCDVMQSEGMVQVDIRYIMQGERCVGKEFTIRTGRLNVCHACGGSGYNRQGTGPCMVCE